MSVTLRIWLVIGVLVYTATILFFLKNKRMILRYSLLWLFSALVLLLFTIFPEIVISFTRLIGVSAPTNALYLLLIFCILLLLISLTAIVSKQHKQIKSLIQHLALLEEKIANLEQ